MDVGLIVDRSGSIREANFKKTKEFLANLVEYFKVHNVIDRWKFNVLSFSSHLYLTIKLSEYFQLPVDPQFVAI